MDEDVRKKPKKKVRLKHIADQLGTSVATVSMAISGKGHISEELSYKVKSLADELGYVPPSRRKPKRKNPVSVVLYRFNPTRDLLWGYFQYVFNSVQGIMREAGYETLVLPVDQEASDKDIFNAIRTIYPDALFTFSDFSDDLKERLTSLDISIVVINESSRHPEAYCSVSPDDIQGSMDGVQYLLKNNHKEIAYLDYTQDKHTLINTSRDRYEGFKQALQKYGVPFSEDRYYQVDTFGEQNIIETLQELMAGENPVTACFVHDDFMALRVWIIADRMGIRVPDDLSILAQGDINDYNHIGPYQISTIQVDTTMMGTTAAELMLELLEKPEKRKLTQAIKLKQVLVDRGSIKKLEP